MADIVLSTINAAWSHPSFGLRCLRAALGPLRDRSALVEFDPRLPVADMARRILDLRPRIAGLGVYIWNAPLIERLATALRSADPGLVLVFGGPEISHETETHPLARRADYIIRGEGEHAFARLCADLLEGRRPEPPLPPAPPPDLASLPLPYEEYAGPDLDRRFIYVETTRGCPFGCDYCLSSTDRIVRRWPLEACLAAFDRLLDRGARRFKFVDRTFNLEPERAAAVLDFFLPRLRPGLHLHFELVPARLPPALRTRMTAFPPGVLRFEVGIQSFDPEVCARVGRRQDPDEAEEVLRFLCTRTGAVVHADLIAGLPGEDLDGFARGFDRLVAIGPDEIQAGILKRLRGTALDRHTPAWGQRFRAGPPYDLLENRLLTADDLVRLNRFSRLWDRYHNHARFPRTLPMLWAEGRSPFHTFLALADAVWARFGRDHALAADDLAHLLLDHLIVKIGAGAPAVRAALAADLACDGRRPTLPRWVR